MRSIESQYNLDPTTLEEIMNEMVLNVVDVPTVTITPTQLNTSWRTGSLVGLTKRGIVRVLGFEPNTNDDEDKVVSSWEFLVDGKPCAIWDFKGSHTLNPPRWSTYDPNKVLDKIFDNRYMGD